MTTCPFLWYNNQHVKLKPSAALAGKSDQFVTEGWRSFGMNLGVLANTFNVEYKWFANRKCQFSV